MGARAPDRHHAARPLDRDALDRAGLARRSIRSPPCCPTRPSESFEELDGRRREPVIDAGLALRPGDRRSRDRASRRAGPRRRRCRRGHRRRGRVDDHGRVASRCSRGLGDRSSRAPSRPTPRCACEFTAVGDDTALAGIQRLVARGPGLVVASAAARRPRRRAGCSGSPSVRRCSPRSPGRIVGTPDDAVTRTITVLVIACPHALGLAIPLVVSIATERAARGGMLITDRLALETMRTVDTVLFDKTGTLTKGEPAVVDASRRADSTPTTSSRWPPRPSATPSTRSRAIVAARSARRGRQSPPRRPFSGAAGVGVHATVAALRQRRRTGDVAREPRPRRSDGSRRMVGPGFDRAARDPGRCGRRGRGPRRRDPPRIEAGHRRPARAWRASGHGHGRRGGGCSSVARRLGIDEVFAGVLPQDKGAQVLGPAVRGPTGSRWSGTVSTTRRHSPRPTWGSRSVRAPTWPSHRGSCAGQRRSPLGDVGDRAVPCDLPEDGSEPGWAAGYNLISVPLAAGVLAPWGFVLPMEVGAMLMSAIDGGRRRSNAQLLRRLDLRPEASTRAVLARTR